MLTVIVFAILFVGLTLGVPATGMAIADLLARNEERARERAQLRLKFARSRR